MTCRDEMTLDWMVLMCKTVSSCKTTQWCYKNPQIWNLFCHVLRSAMNTVWRGSSCLGVWRVYVDQRIFQSSQSFRRSHKCLAVCSCFHNTDDKCVFSPSTSTSRSHDVFLCDSYKVFFYVWKIYWCVCACAWRFLCARKHASSCSGAPLIGHNLQWLWLHEVFTSSQNTRSHTDMHFRTQKRKPT